MFYRAGESFPAPLLGMQVTAPRVKILRDAINKMAANKCDGHSADAGEGGGGRGGWAGVGRLLNLCTAAAAIGRHHNHQQRELCYGPKPEGPQHDPMADWSSRLMMADQTLWLIPAQTVGVKFSGSDASTRCITHCRCARRTGANVSGWIPTATWWRWRQPPPLPERGRSSAPPRCRMRGTLGGAPSRGSMWS